jgi:hypothetical protein
MKMLILKLFVALFLILSGVILIQTDLKSDASADRKRHQAAVGQMITEKKRELEQSQTARDLKELQLRYDSLDSVPANMYNMSGLLLIVVGGACAYAFTVPSTKKQKKNKSTSTKP